VAPRAVLVDLDGTLWDSFPWYAAILEDWSGVPRDHTLAALRQHQPVVRLFERHRITKAEFGRLCARYGAALRLYPNVRETLAELKTDGVLLGVVTGLPGTYAEPMLASSGLAHVFDAVVHRGNCPTPKPSPVALNFCRSMLRLEPDSSSIWYIGDLDTDARAAHAALMSFAWASYGYAAGQVSADAELACFAEVLDL
jgi:phosphoglycolate phosphatase-like HAD superfamily hydrolase